MVHFVDKRKVRLHKHPQEFPFEFIKPMYNTKITLHPLPIV